MIFLSLRVTADAEGGLKNRAHLRPVLQGYCLLLPSEHIIQCKASSILRYPAQFHCSGFTVEVFYHDTLDNVAFFQILVIIAVPIQEQNNIRFWHKRVRFSQVRQYGPLVFPFLGGAAELAETEYWNS